MKIFFLIIPVRYILRLRFAVERQLIALISLALVAMTCFAGCSAGKSATIANGGKEYDFAWYLEDTEDVLLQFGTYLSPPRLEVIEENSRVISPSGVSYPIFASKFDFDLQSGGTAGGDVNVRTIIRRQDESGFPITGEWENGRWKFLLNSRVAESGAEELFRFDVLVSRDQISPLESAIQYGRLPRDG